MGICFEAVDSISFLKNDGLLGDVNSMVELGNQHVRYDRSDVVSLLRKHGIETGGVRTTADFYRLWGISEYISIDLNGEDGAIELDLNKPFTRDETFNRTFDLTTNFGTTEHCFDQATAFENIHNLTRIGGYMLHVLPAHGWDGHCFYRYDRNLFMDLAHKCQYEILSLHYYVRPLSFRKYLGMVRKNFPANKRPAKVSSFDRSFSRNGLVAAVLRKTGELFSFPMQGMYEDLEKQSLSRS